MILKFILKFLDGLKIINLCIIFKDYDMDFDLSCWNNDDWNNKRDFMFNYVEYLKKLCCLLDMFYCI